MNVDIFVYPDDPAAKSLARVLAPYSSLLRVAWHASESSERYQQLLLASMPLDAGTGHTIGGEPTHPREMSYGYYGAYGQPAGTAPLPAVAVYDRMALLPSSGGPPRQVRPGVWTVPFHVEDLVRAAFHQALEAALAEVREAHGRLLTLQPGLLHEPAATLLQVRPEALDRALRRITRRL